MSLQPEHLVEASLVVADIDRARSFYERVFGLEAMTVGGGGVGLRLPNGTMLLLFPQAARPAQLGAPSAHLRFGLPAGALGEWDRHLMMQGVVVENRVLGRNGTSSLFFRDPDQNSLELAVDAT